MTVIRTARPDDANQVAELLTELGYPGNGAEDVRARLATWEVEPHGTALIAEAKGRVAGLVAAVTVPYIERSGRWGRVVALVVSEDFRGRGLGRRLMEAAEDVAAADGCVSMEISSSRRRAGAHAFYRSLGYEDRCERSASFFRSLSSGRE